MQDDESGGDVPAYRNNNINNIVTSGSNNNNNVNLDSADGMVRNPLLASFRRNNDIQETNNFPRGTLPQPQRTTVKRANPPATAAAAVGRQPQPADQQSYDQLQQHIDSIRTIFETLMKERCGGGSMTSSVTAAATANEFALQPQQQLQFLQSLMQPAINPATFAVQQQQLTISLLSCQQQLQLQQMELRYLQQLCHDLVNLQQRSPAASDTAATAGQPPTRSRSASFAQAPAGQNIARNN